MTSHDLAAVQRLAAAGRWDAAAEALEAVWPTDRVSDPYGDNFVRAAGWWEECGDQLGAPEAYRRAHAAIVTFASWATSGGEGIARMVDVKRLEAKLGRQPCSRVRA